MARGYIYHVSTNVEEITDRNSIADDVCEHCDLLAIDYAKDVEKENVREIRKNFLDFLEQYGAETGEDKDNFSEEKIPYFVLTDEVKENYFKYPYEHLLTLIRHIDLAGFATQDQSGLIDCIEYGYGDCIYHNDFPEPLDRFIREAESGVKYYIGAVAYMD